ncbi:MAG: hypothetical protein ACLQGV_14695 [Bryobacteraceae bacterium]
MAIEREMMSKPGSRVLAFALCVFLLFLVSCAHQAPVSLRGHYTSKEDYGVFVFRGDGTFGYKFAAMLDFYSEDDLPPIRGRYRIVGGRIELSGLPANQPKFELEARDGGQSFLLIREERDGTLPHRALYRKE